MNNFIHIDSLSRDAIYYKQPFAFKITCKPSIELSSQYTNTPEPHLAYEYYDITEFGITYVTLPAYAKWIPNPSATNNWDSYIPDPDSKLVNMRYICLRINELESKRLVSTNYHIDQAAGTLLQVLDDGDKYIKCKSLVTHEFEDTKVIQKIRTLTIKFILPDGKPLEYDHLDYSMDPNIECTGNPLNDKCKQHYPRNPLYNDLQLSFVLRIKGKSI